MSEASNNMETQWGNGRTAECLKLQTTRLRRAERLVNTQGHDSSRVG